MAPLTVDRTAAISFPACSKPPPGALRRMATRKKTTAARPASPPKSTRSGPPAADPAQAPAPGTRVGIIMGSISDWGTMEHAAEILTDFGIAYETRVVSAHRTPALLVEYAETAQERGLQVIIAGAGGAAHLPGMTASMTPLPVLGVPVESKALKGMDSLLSIVQMPGGVPVGTFAIGKAGAINAALFAASILALTDPGTAARLKQFRDRQTAKVLASQAELPA